jgi:hypothetical protein
MHELALGFALLLAAGIIAIGAQYILSPIAATRMFGLPLPDYGVNTLWWLRPKGVRDIVSGLTVLAFMAWATSRETGILLLVLAIIPVGDMLLILAARGSTGRAFGIHGVTALVMILTAMALIMGVR